MAYVDKEKQKAAQDRSYLKNKDRIAKRKISVRERNKEFVKNAKQGKKCFHCGESRIPCLDFHHSNPEDKKESISRAIRGYSLEALQKEIDKCIILCANCHRLVHSGDIKLALNI